MKESAERSTAGAITHAAQPPAPGLWLMLGCRSLASLAALALLAVALRAWPLMIDLLDYPFAIDYGEGVVAGQVERLLDGQPLYPTSDLTGPGFVGANYPPLYYLLAALVPDHATSIYFDARLISFVAYLATALLAGLLALRLARWWPAGLVTAGTFLALPPAREWGIFEKPDLLALAFSTAGLLVATLVSGRRVLWAAPLFALGLLTKQVVLVAPLAIGLWLLLTPGRRRVACELGALTATLVLLPLIALELKGQAVFWHLLLANTRGWAWSRFDGISLTFLEIYRPALVAAVGLPVLAWWRPSLRPLALYLPLALLTLLAAGQPGASRNYALEAGLALALAAS